MSSSATGFPSMMLRHVQQAISSIGGRTSTSYTYEPIDPESSAPGTATRRGPRTLLQSRWGKIILAGALVVFMVLIGSVTDVPSTITNYATDKFSSPGVSQPATIPGSPNSKPTSPDTPPEALTNPPADASDGKLAGKPLTFESTRATLTKEEYIDAVLRNPVEGLPDLKPIRAMCDATKFQPGLVWHCELVNGGIGNVGNMWLNCVRFAIEAGATTIIVPRIGARSEKVLFNLGDDAHSVELDTLYDVDYFINNWKEACPQMRAVRTEKEVPGIPPLSEAPAIRANSFSAPRMRELMLDTKSWRAGFDDWMTKNVPVYQNMSAKEPLRIRQRLALSNWNREAHSADFADSFPRLFRFPQKMRRLAAATLWNLEKKTGKIVVSDAILFPDLVMVSSDDKTSLDDSSSIVTTLGKDRLPAQGYLGAHLRVAEDAKMANWPGYEAQAPAYLDEAERSSLSVVYLATGSAQHREMFHADASARNIQVVTKEDLLEPDELTELQSLTWDQQAIIDFEVLVHSSRFAGFVRSSFSWVIAIRRSILPEAGKAVITKRDIEGGEVSSALSVRREGHARRQEAADSAATPAEPAVAIATAPATPAAPAEPIVEKYRDGLSVVVGRYDAMTINGIWP
ncbi:hypothetical protein SEUCBS139899_003535 [Sporothrix eucalyptigena]|uniref:Alternative oxidase n=1 Tax=Sporothrix eucalyptigena TaxID=1812306 RepID=A0ABP0B768_9PEZI